MVLTIVIDLQNFDAFYCLRKFSDSDQIKYSKLEIKEEKTYFFSKELSSDKLEVLDFKGNIEEQK
jgi:hypothetical protein